MLQHRLTVLSLLLTVSVFCQLARTKWPKPHLNGRSFTFPPKDPRSGFFLFTRFIAQVRRIWAGASRYNLHFDGRQFVPVQNQAGRERAWRSVGPLVPQTFSSRCARQVAHFDEFAWRGAETRSGGLRPLYVIAWPNQVIVTAGGSELHRFDGKLMAKSVPQSRNASLHRLFGLSPNNLYVQVTKGKKWPPVVAHFDGTTWKLETLGERAGTVYALHGSAPMTSGLRAKSTRLWGWRAAVAPLMARRGRKRSYPSTNRCSMCTPPARRKPGRAVKNGVILRWDGRQWTRSASGTKQGRGTLCAARRQADGCDERCRATPRECQWFSLLPAWVAGVRSQDEGGVLHYDAWRRAEPRDQDVVLQMDMVKMSRLTCPSSENSVR